MQICQQFSKSLALARKTEYEELEKEIRSIETELSLSPTNHQLLNALQNSRHKLTQHIAYRTEGLRIRSRIKWLLEGERPTRYFFSLAKSRRKQSTIRGLYQNQDPNRLKTSLLDINNVAKQYYQSLYTTENVDTQAWDEIFTGWSQKISAAQQTLLEMNYTDEELLQQLRRMANNKSPGMDGLPVEWYRCFWEEVKVFLVAIANDLLNGGNLSSCMEVARITLLHKKNDLHDIRNYRPITQLCVDY